MNQIYLYIIPKTVKVYCYYCATGLVINGSSQLLLADLSMNEPV